MKRRPEDGYIDDRPTFRVREDGTIEQLGDDGRYRPIPKQPERTVATGPGADIGGSPPLPPRRDGDRDA